MKELLRKYRWTLVGIGVGALGGFLYWRWIGCSGGSCPITSSPIVSTLWGALMGGLLLSAFETKEETK